MLAPSGANVLYHHRVNGIALSYKDVFVGSS